MREDNGLHVIDLGGNICKLYNLNGPIPKPAKCSGPAVVPSGTCDHHGYGYRPRALRFLLPLVHQQVHVFAGGGTRTNLLLLVFSALFLEPRFCLVEGKRNRCMKKCTDQRDRAYNILLLVGKLDLPRPSRKIL